ncbi:MAG: LysR substrate-binding domain-containing protein, partial [Gammaproteobacteria bacterium]
EAILMHARQIMEQVDAIEQLARASQDPLAGPLRVGAIPTLSPYLMPLILAPLKKQHPQMKLVLSEELTETLLERLQNHEIDAALLATTVDEPDLSSLPLFEEPFWIAYPRKHPFYTKDKITRKDLERENLLLLAEGHCLADQAMEVCHMQERSNQGDFADLRAASLETLLQLVGAGYGTTLVPALALRGSWTTGSGVVAQPLELPHATRRVSLVYRNSFPRLAALEAFAEVIRANLPNTVSLISEGKRHRQKSISHK